MSRLERAQFALIGLAGGLAACASQPLDRFKGAGGDGAADAGGTAGAGATPGDAAGSEAAASIPSHPGSLVIDRARVSSDAQAEHYQQVFAATDFGTVPIARATLFVELESPCFPFDKWTPAAIPAGQRWPVLCDAFDRTLEISIDNPTQSDSGPPGLELSRAVTPFGGPLSVAVDVTDAVNGLPGAHELRVRIPTYGDLSGQVSGAQGEWRVSAWLELVPGTPPRRVLAVLPLAYGSVVSARPAPVSFEVPAGAHSARIEYRATGHGGGSSLGCSGPAEEFCRRSHTLLVDGRVVDEFEAWRTDCATLCTPAHYASTSINVDYCAENPCGAPESVRASRANWCPGSVTPPRTVEGAAPIEPGPHQFEWSVSALAEGGSWLVSATYYAFE